MRGVLTLVLLAFCSSHALTQAWHFAIEGGINVSGIPHSDLGDKIRPELSPLIGAHYTYTAPSGFYTDLGVRYCLVGTRTTSSSTVQGPMGPLTSTREEIFHFQKLSFGLGMGHQFRLGKKTFSAGGGYRLLYFPYGTYQWESETFDTSGAQQFDFGLIEPFEDQRVSEPASRIGHELFLVLGMTVTEKFCVQLQYGAPTKIQFTESGFGGESAVHTYSADDISVTGFFKLGK